jgi:hypothetical protein
MVINCPGEEWVMKLGPISRTNQAGSRKQAEEGAIGQVKEGVQEIMAAAQPLIPLLMKGAMCAGECDPVAKVDDPEITVTSYKLDDGKWFSIAATGFFGVKLACKK